MSSRRIASKRSRRLSSAGSRRSRWAASNLWTIWKVGVKRTERPCRTSSEQSAQSRCVLPVPGLPRAITLTARSRKAPSRRLAKRRARPSRQPLQIEGRQSLFPRQPRLRHQSRHSPLGPFGGLQLGKRQKVSLVREPLTRGHLGEGSVLPNEGRQVKGTQEHRKARLGGDRAHRSPPAIRRPSS